MSNLVKSKNILPVCILKNIFKYLSFSDFKNSRTVSKNWKNITNDKNLHKSYIISINKGNISLYDKMIPSFLGIRIKMYKCPVETIHNIKNIDLFVLSPFTKIKDLYMLRNIHTLDFTHVFINSECLHIIKLQGLHKIIRKNGCWVYEGNFKDGKLNGQGKIITKNGSIYEGQFKDNNLNGQGKIIDIEYNGCWVYEGEFKDNLLNGQGKIISKNGCWVYEGEFKDNLLNGQGKIISKNGCWVYEGEFKDNLLNGQGKIISKNGVIYEGEFKDNKLNDQGNITTNGIIKCGEFKFGKLNGQGKIISKNGCWVYEGEFKDNLLNGQGKIISKNGSVKGEFKFGKLNGQGKIIRKSGSISEGEFKDGLLQ
jgi:hypothetical protein